ncbi:hypothetical protein J437_LFUL003424 [Ladona fulva]|uniref:tRNA pseudouridine(55) synthase n=1 Tax=Ladona fulva TaxID=123851 RepID=A0A8K0K770_LADFU|nr:hypothetical protein J437_LFUL003424 [Ladona fulva]
MMRLNLKGKLIPKLPIVFCDSWVHSKSHELSLERKIKIIENGVFAVHKEKNLASTETVEIIKSILASDFPIDILKVGHGGVLDKTATGVLVLGLCNGCKILPKFLHGTKNYEVKGRLGISTSTYNETGEIVDQLPYDHVTKDDLSKCLNRFIGDIKQTPPAYSSLKLNGRRYSDLAREGIEVPLKPRPVKCYSLTCSSFEPPYFSLSLKCGSGFYVRSLIHDIGKAVGSCAHVVELHRTQHGVFKDDEALVRDKWTTKEILRSIQAAKRKHKNLFSKFDNDKNMKNNKDKEINIPDDLFDL